MSQLYDTTLCIVILSVRAICVASSYPVLIVHVKRCREDKTKCLLKPYEISPSSYRMLEQVLNVDVLSTFRSTHREADESKARLVQSSLSNPTNGTAAELLPMWKTALVRRKSVALVVYRH